MKIEVETKNVYVSADGKKRSYSRADVEAYEARQIEKQFTNRTLMTHLGDSTTFYSFAEGDVKFFKQLHQGVKVVTDNTHGYFVYVRESCCDHVGDDYSLYSLEEYQDMIGDRINHLNSILDDISTAIAMRNVASWAKNPRKN